MKLTSGKFCALSASALIALACGQANAAIFNYNVIVTGTHNDSSHIQGMTFDNNLNVTNVPDFGQNTSGAGDWLDVAGTVTGSGLTLEHGIFRYAGTLPNPFSFPGNGGSTEVHDTTVSITALSNEMTADTSYYAGLATTGTGLYSGSQTNTYSIIATQAGTNVFNIAASALSYQNENIDITAPAGDYVVIQVADSSFTLGNSMHIQLEGGTSDSQILWVFPNATTISFNTMFEGSILAPKALLTDNSISMNGGVYVANFNQTGEVHLGMYDGSPPPVGGNPPAVPEPASLALLSVGALGLLKRGRRSR